MKNVSENRHLLLQHSRTRLYYVRDGNWTSDPAQARDFVTTQAAVLYSRAHALGDAQIVVHFHRPELHDLVLPLAWSQPTEACLTA